MSQDLNVGVKITADSRGLVGESRAAREAIKGIGDQSTRTTTESAKLTQETRHLNAAQRNASSQAQAHASSLISLRAGMVAAVGAYASYTAAINGGKAVIDAALAQERLNNSLKVGLGSQQAATQEIKFLREESERLGLEFSSTAAQYAKLTAASKGTELQGQATRDIFLSIAKASTVLGLSADQTGGALLAIEQMISKGTVSAEELRGQLGERLPGAFQLAARAIGVTTAELGDMLQKGEVAAEQLLPALAAELDKTYGAQAQQAAQGLNAQINRLDNSFTDLKLAVGKAGLVNLFSDGVVEATKFIGVTAQVIQKIKDISDAANQVPFLGTLLKASGSSSTLFGGLSSLLGSGEANAQDINETAKAINNVADASDRLVKPGQKPEVPSAFVKARKAETAEREKAIKSREREAQQAVAASQRVIDALKKETAEVGKNAVQKRMMAAAAEAAKAPTQALAQEILDSAQAWKQATLQQEALLAAEKDRLQAIANIERAEQQAARRTAQEWARVGSRIEQTARSAFIQFATHGKSAMESIGEAIKLSIIEVLYQLTIRRWIVNIGTNFVGGNSGGGVNGGTSTLSNFLNAGSAATNFFSGSGGGGFTAAFGSGLQSVASRFGLQAASQFGAGLAASSTQVAAAEGAATLWGTSGVSGATSAGMSATSAIPIVGWAILANTIANGLLDNDKTVLGAGQGTLNNIAQGPLTRKLQGTLGLGNFTEDPALKLITTIFGRAPYKFRRQNLDGTVTADGFDGDVEDVYRSKGGWLWSNRRKRIRPSNADDIIELFDTAVTGLTQSTRGFVDNLGLSTQALDDLSLTVALESEKKKRLTEQDITAELGRLGNEIARSVVPNIDEYIRHGEDARTTLARLSTEFTSLTGAATIMNRTVAESRELILGLSIDARTALIDNAGGPDAFNQKINFFADNFLTAKEKYDIAFGGLDAQMQRVGLSASISKDEFKGLVQSFGKVGGVSEETFQTLLNVQGAFLAVNSAGEQLAKTARTNVDTAFTDLQRSVDAERTKVTDAYNTALEESNKRIQDVTESVGELKSLSDALKSTVSTLLPLGRDAAKQQIQEAVNIARSGGGLPDAESLRDALSTLGRQSTTGFSSQFEFDREQRKTAILVGNLEKLTDDQLTLEERSLSALEASRARLDLGFAEETKRLDSIVENAQTQVGLLGGIDGKLLTIADAMSAFAASLAGAGVAGSDVINRANLSVVGGSSGQSGFVGPSRTSDQDIRDFFATPRTAAEIEKAALDNNVSSARIAQVMNLSGSQVNRFFADNPNIKKFAGGGSFGGGLRIVGERGPELEATGPSHITSNNDLKHMMSNEDVVLKIADLILKLEKNTDFNKRVSNKLDSLTVTDATGRVYLRTGTT